MDTLWQDLRYAARLLARQPSFTLVVVLTLALGIGANTAIFSLTNAALLRPLPGREPAQLAAVYTSDFSGPLYGTSSYPDYLDFRDRNQVFSGLLAYTPTPMVLSRDEQSVRLIGELASGNYFDVLRINAAYGRGFLPEEDRPGAAASVVVFSHGIWKRHFGADPSAVGRTLSLNGKPFTIIGVAPEGFTGLTRGLGVDLWVPANTQPVLLPGRDWLHNRGNRSFFVFGRLRPGVALESARANFNLIARQLYDAYPDNWVDRRGEPRRATVLPESQARIFPAIRGPVWAFLGLLQAVVALVLLIACVNVASLLLARAVSRRREIAVRQSLGASRGRLVRQLLTESLLLSLLAGAAGAIVAAWATDLLMAFQPPLPVTVALDLRLDLRVLCFTLAASILTGLLFGLAPAWQAAKTDLVSSLKDEFGVGSYRKVRLRNALVVSQVALSLLLLIGAGLFLRSLAHAKAIDPGLDPDGVMLASVNLDLQGYSEAEGRVFFEQLQERLEAHPAIESASVASMLPLGLSGGRRSISIEGYEPAQGEDMEVHYNVVGPGYFETLRIPLVRGRSFTPQDTAASPGAVVVNEAFVSRYWPGQDPLGKRLALGRITEGEQTYPLAVVGIVRDGKYVTPGEESRPFVFYPHRQNYESEMTILVRAAGEADAAGEGIRTEIRALAPSLATYDVKSLHEHMGLALFPVRLAASLTGGMGALALLLAAIGLYGVMAYSVSQRTREIGIRLALGAQPAQVLQSVISQGLRVTALGVILGLAAAFALTRFLTFILYGISPTDPVTFLAVPLLLAGVAVLACYVPARRAARVDPMTALRYE